MSADLSPGSPEWMKIVTASKAPSILGLSPYSTPAETWALMRGDIPFKAGDSDAMFRGHQVESYAVNYFWQRRNPTWCKAEDGYLWERDDAPWAACNSDSHGMDDQGAPVIVEAKSVGKFADLTQWGEEGTDQVPIDYWVQCVFMMWVSGIRTTFVERVGPGLDDHACYRIDYDPVFGNRMAAKLAEFHASLSDDDARPEPSQPSDRAIYARNERIEEVSWEIDPVLADEYVTNALAATTCTDLSKLAAAKILHAMGDAKYATVNGQRIARRQKNKSGTALYRIADSVETTQEEAA